MRAPPCSSAPCTVPSSNSSCLASPVSISTPLRFMYRINVSTTSTAWSDVGNTRFPRSTLRGRPCASKKDITSRGGNADAALYKKRPLEGTEAISSCTSQSFVTLQRPLPVIINFRPGRAFFSTRQVRSPRAAAVPAASIPAAPPPITSASYVWLTLVFIHLFVNSVFIPDVLQVLEDLFDLIGLFQGNGDNQGID